MLSEKGRYSTRAGSRVVRMGKLKSPLGATGSVSGRPIRIQLLGLWPAVLQPCGPSCARPFVNAPVEALSQEEMDETPGFMRENGERAHAFAERLHADFGDRIRIEVVGLDSPRGIWLGARHRVGRGFAVVVGGRTVVRDPEEYSSLHAAVQEAVTESEAHDG